MQFQDDVAGGVVLIRPALQSPDYVPGTSGWQVAIDGSAEFNDVTIRGGTSVSGTSLYYNPSPGPGTLTLSMAAAAGTDEYGNTYPRGLSVGSDTTRQVVLDNDGSNSYILFSANNAVEQISGGLVQASLNQGLPNEYLSLQVFGPTVKTFGQVARIQLNSQNADGSSNANIALAADDHTLTMDRNIVSVNGPRLTVIPDPSASPAASVRTAAGHTGHQLQLVHDGTVTLTTDNTGTITQYGRGEFGTFTPVVGNAGGATWTVRTGWWQRLGPMIYVLIHLQVNTAGSGTTPLTIDMPTNVYRGTRQVLLMHTESTGPNGSHIGSGECVFFAAPGGSPTSDRLRTSSNDATNRQLNLSGQDLLAGGVITVQGWYREQRDA